MVPAPRGGRERSKDRHKRATHDPRDGSCQLQAVDRSERWTPGTIDGIHTDCERRGEDEDDDRVAAVLEGRFAIAGRARMDFPPELPADGDAGRPDLRTIRWIARWPGDRRWSGRRGSGREREIARRWRPRVAGRAKQRDRYGESGQARAHAVAITVGFRGVA